MSTVSLAVLREQTPKERALTRAMLLDVVRTRGVEFVRWVLQNEQLPVRVRLEALDIACRYGLGSPGSRHLLEGERTQRRGVIVLYTRDPHAATDVPRECSPLPIALPGGTGGDA